MKKTTYKEVEAFEREFGIYSEDKLNYGYPTKELGNQYAKLKCDWWGNNLVYIGLEEYNGLYFPGFNVWN